MMYSESLVTVPVVRKSQKHQRCRRTSHPIFILVAVTRESHLHSMFHKQQCQTVSVLNCCQQWNSIHTNIKTIKISELRFNGIKGYTSYFIQTSLFYLQMKIISGTSEAGRTALAYFFKNPKQDLQISCFVYLQKMVAFFANIQTY